jgi:myo-inositol-1(or 4)-monophosphatase
MPSTDAALIAYSAELRSAATEAAQLVADDLRTAFRGTMTVEFKRDQHDPVTVHDRRAEEAITKSLTARIPDSGIVGEEDGAQPGTGSVTWYVDPIDGTANFARGLAFWCTSIGAVVDDQIVAGAILDPMTGNLFTADLSGAYLNDAPMHSTGHRDEAEAYLLTGYPSAHNIADDGPDAVTRFGELVTAYGSLRRAGSTALSLAHVAAGWVDASMDTSINAWDICAGRLLVEQAGGTYHPFGGTGWNQPGYLAHTADLDAVALNSFVTSRA